MIEQPLGEVHRVDAELLRLPLQRDDELVARAPIRIRGVEARLLQACQHVVRVQRSIFGDALHSGATEHAHIDVGAQQHAGVTHECRQATDRLRHVGCVEPAIAIAVLADDRNRQERQQALADADRTGARPAAAVRRRERLVQIHVNDVESHGARTHLAENRVEVRAVVIQQAAGLVDQLGNLLDATLEHAERRRIGEHDAGGARTERLFQRLHVSVAVRQRWNFDYGAAAHRRRRRIRAVRGIRHDDLRPLHVATRAVIGADHRHARELALRARHRRQRNALHAGHFLQHLLQLEHAAEEALADRVRRQRMPAEELGQHRELIARARVVFHRARAERIEVRVDREIELRQAREMAHRLQL